MSAIYGDPTLGANLKFVILRLIFYEGNGSEDDDEAVGTSNVESSRYNWQLFHERNNFNNRFKSLSWNCKALYS